MPRPTQTPDALRERARALLARAAAKDARASAVLRKRETHKKIVAGGFFLSLVGADLSRLTPELRAKMEREITRPHDRRALGLTELSTSTQSSDE
jgi:hypothetical protein